VIAVAVIALFAVINCAGVLLGGRVQTILTSTKVISILAVGRWSVFCTVVPRIAGNLAPSPRTARFRRG